MKDLLIEMVGFDFVVTSKFHGVVFSHLLAKPVIALSYHNKIDDLMRTVGHSEYCLNIENFDAARLERAFMSLVENAQELKWMFRRTRIVYSNALKAQFDELFVPENQLLRSRVSGAARKRVALGGSA